MGEHVTSDVTLHNGSQPQEFHGVTGLCAALTEIEEVEKQIDHLTKRREMLYEAVTHTVTDLPPALQRKIVARLTDMVGIPMATNGGSARQPQSNVSVYEEIILAHGNLMTLDALTDKVLARGLQLSGGPDTQPREKIRNSLQGSKRFENLGDNHWTVVKGPKPVAPVNSVRPDCESTDLPPYGVSSPPSGLL